MSVKSRCLFAWLLYVVLAGSLVHADDLPLVTFKLSGATRIRAGDAWTLTVQADDAKDGETVGLTLLHGFQTFDTTLRLDANGSAQWTFPADKLTTAGISIVLARWGSLEADFNLKVMPLEAEHIDAFSTMNTIMAYGTQCGAFLALGQDKFGNPLDHTATGKLTLRSVGGESKIIPLSFANGLAYSAVCSLGDPGKLFMMVEVGTLNTTLTLDQVAGTPAKISLDVEPICVEQSQRDSLLINLLAQVSDAHDKPVVDGTPLRFQWTGGYGVALTSDGRAVLSIPYPSDAASVTIVAMVGEATSTGQTLQLARSCASVKPKLGH